MVESDVRLLATFRRLGMRILQPTYNEPCLFGQGAPDIGDADKGITEAGRAWVAEMHANRLLIDLSHCGHRTSADFIAEAREPVMFSHANAFAVCPSPRNKPDDLIASMAWQQNPTRWCSTGNLIAALKITNPERVEMLNYSAAVDNSGADLYGNALN